MCAWYVFFYRFIHNMPHYESNTCSSYTLVHYDCLALYIHVYQCLVVYVCMVCVCEVIMCTVWGGW
jgi:hypothetical protein